MAHTSIFSSISCFAWSICWGDPLMVNSLKFGSPFGGGWRDISTNAPVCWLMDLTFSPPLPITRPHLWAGMEKVISPPGGPQFPWPRPHPPGPGGPCKRKICFLTTCKWISELKEIKCLSLHLPLAHLLPGHGCSVAGQWWLKQHADSCLVGPLYGQSYQDLYHHL